MIYTQTPEQAAKRAQMLEDVSRKLKPHAFPSGWRAGPPDLRPSWQKMASAMIDSGQPIAVAFDRRIEA